MPEIALSRLRGPPPHPDKLLRTVSRCAKSSATYAERFKTRFELGEPAIATSASLSYTYAFNVLKGRFLPGESIISQDGCYALLYANNVLRGPFEEGEPAISKLIPQLGVLYQKLRDGHVTQPGVFTLSVLTETSLVSPGYNRDLRAMIETSLASPDYNRDLRAMIFRFSCATSRTSQAHRGVGNL